ncbi:MAG: PAS domain-containing protein, partial [Magnetococcales bacterium]|nr:PAS domain-containing protein [Magnetococcales bacterium]
IQKGINDAIRKVNILGTLMQAKNVKPEEFEFLVSTLFSQINSIKHVLWIRETHDANREPVVLWSHEKYKKQLPSILKARQSAHPVLPGYDFVEDHDLTALLQKAKSLDHSIVITQFISPRFSAQAEFTLLIPLLKTGGYILALFDLEEIVQQAIRLLEPRGVRILILNQDHTGKKTVIDSYSSRLESTPNEPILTENWQSWLEQQKHSWQDTLTVNDRSLIIIATPTKNLLSGEGFPYTPWIILCGGIMITLIVSVFLLNMEKNLLEKNRLYTELKKSAIKLRILFNQYPDTIMTVDRHGTVLLSNRSEMDTMASMLGEDQQNLYEWYLQSLRRVYETGEMDHFQYPCSENNWCEVRFVPIRNEGEIDEVMILSADITEKFTQQEQAIRYARLASLGILAAGMAHEINNPNNTIQFNIITLIRSWPDLAAVLRKYREEHGEFGIGGVEVGRAMEMLPKLLESIKGNTQRIAGIVDNLKRMVRPDKGDMNYTIDLVKVIRNAVSIIQHPIKRHTDHFEVIISDDIPILIGNPLQLEQIFINLLMNALQSLPNREAAVKLLASLSKDGRWVSVQIIDEGIGMTEQEIANMFAPFFTTKAEHGGLGMGLSIVWDIVHRHGGAIKTESQPGQGTTITVWLPVSDGGASVA